MNTTPSTGVPARPSRTPLDDIPDPEEVRTRLVACTREASLLRSLLRLAERHKRQRASADATAGREVSHAG